MEIIAPKALRKPLLFVILQRQPNPEMKMKRLTVLLLAVAATLAAAAQRPPTSLDGSCALFIGNSFVYYGGCVEKGDCRRPDTGMFHRICRANGERVTVYDCTYGRHHLRDFTAAGCRIPRCADRGCGGTGSDLLRGVDLRRVDLVFFSESGDDNPDFLADCRAVMRRFTEVNPDVRFFYLVHPYSYLKHHTHLTNALPALEAEGVTIVDWGRLVCDLIADTTARPAAAWRYSRTSFIKNKGDSHHPNPLSGYLTAQMCYCAASGRSAVGQSCACCEQVRCNDATGFDDFVEKHYAAPSDTDFREIFASPAAMTELQRLMDDYLKPADRRRPQ